MGFLLSGFFFPSPFTATSLVFILGSLFFSVVVFLNCKNEKCLSLLIIHSREREVKRERLEIILKFCSVVWLTFFFVLYQAGKSFVNFYVNGSDNSFKTGCFSAVSRLLFPPPRPTQGCVCAPHFRFRNCLVYA